MEHIIDSAFTDSGFAQVENSVEALFQELGARVVHEVTYTGEPTVVRLHIPAEQSDATRAFANRPA
jgi:hypothetical protein